MMMHGGNGIWGGSILMTVALVMFGALLITAVVLTVRYLISLPDTGSAVVAGMSRAESLLAERYSRGFQLYSRCSTVLLSRTVGSM
jgi:putative membrane protein